VYGWRVNQASKEEHARQESQDTSKMDDSSPGLSLDDISQTVASFTREHPELQVDVQDSNHIFEVWYALYNNKGAFAHASQIPLQIGYFKATLRIAAEKLADGRYRINAECLGNTNISASITRCISLRPNANDLKYLLVRHTRRIHGSPSRRATILTGVGDDCCL